MPRASRGSFRLIRVAGIDVFLHWSWFVVAMFEINGRAKTYSSLTFNLLEYLALFLIVMLHEFGHALACRRVGGTASQIVLWPLGGVAYVNPPQRPGATLWSVAAGPLVNLVLVPVLSLLGIVSRSLGWATSLPDFQVLLRAIWFINFGLLLFNILPIYPLDGGQILRSLLWYVLGRGRSLMVAAIIGLAGVAGFIVLALWTRSAWYGLISVFVLMNCWRGLKQARALSRLAKLPRRNGFACPGCNTAPPLGEFWKCLHCGRPFDTFLTLAVCPHCAARFPTTSCVDCGGPNPMEAWIAQVTVPTL